MSQITLEGVKSVKMPARKVSFAIKDKLKQTLDRQEQLEIIKSIKNLLIGYQGLLLHPSQINGFDYTLMKDR